jgi:hypothetical protein
VNDVAKQTMVLLRRVAEFFEELPEEHIADLAEGRARLTYIPWGADQPVKPAGTPYKRTAAAKASKATVDVATVRAALEAATSREEGRSLLRALPLVDDVKAVAAGLGMTGVSRTGKDKLIEQIVELTVGGRLSSAAIRVL